MDMAKKKNGSWNLLILLFINFGFFLFSYKHNSSNNSMACVNKTHIKSHKHERIQSKQAKKQIIMTKYCCLTIYNNHYMDILQKISFLFYFHSSRCNVKENEKKKEREEWQYKRWNSSNKTNKNHIESKKKKKKKENIKNTKLKTSLLVYLLLL